MRQGPAKQAVWIVLGVLSIIAAFWFGTWSGDGGRADGLHFLALVLVLWAVLCFWSAREAK